MEKNQFTDLGYDYKALEPFIDEETMLIHYGKHYRNYYETFIGLIKKHNLSDMRDVKEILSNLNEIPPEIRESIINSGGGYFNHRFFWTILKKNVSFEGEIKEEILRKWGSFDNFKQEFSDAAKSQFGSGWAWLVLDKNKELKIIKTSNQDSPISYEMTPLLALDVWEHAYYLKYQNRRTDYIGAFFNIINWNVVNNYYLEVK